MQGSTRLSPGHKVALMAGGLMAMAVATAVAVGEGQASVRFTALDLDLHWWQFAIAFCIAELAVVHIEIRREAVTLSLSESVLLVALLTISPAGVIAARAIGGGAALLWRRPTAQKAIFNIALFAWEAAMAVLFRHVVFQFASSGAASWAASAVSVLIAALLSVAAVATVISFFDSQRPIGLLQSALGVQAVIAMPSISLAIVGVAAVAQSRWNVAYIAFMFIGIALLLRRDASTTQRASDMEAIGQFTAKLVGLTRTTEVAETSLREIAHSLRANRAALVLSPTNAVASRTYRLDTDDVKLSVEYEFWRFVTDLTEPGPVEAIEHDGRVVVPACVAAPIVVNHHCGMIVVWDRATEIGQFLPRDPAILGAMADQVHVALGRAALIDQLHYDAHHDALSQLPNRLGFAEQLATCPELHGALFVLDLDRFKDINDTLGHPTGDRVLQIIARRLEQAVAGTAMLARLGGDEFAVFNRHADDVTTAAEFASQLVDIIEAPVKLEDLSLQLGASIGIALAPAHGNDLTALMSHADTAMYEAKANQSGWQFYRHDADANDPRRLELVTELRRAIQNRSLEVWYQPRICLEDRKVVGAEALARWNHERYGFVPPDEFIVLAEGAGLMRDLTDAILERTISDIRRWNEYGIELQVAVNLSTRNLLDDSLSGRVAKMLSTSEIPTERLSFEITETAIMIDRERVAGLLGEFHALGITLAIDDYGTGYSSLAYLRELPVDELKIDRSFISNVDFDPRNEVIVRSTIDMAHNLGLVVVAEGIEREEEFALLTTLGCDFSQGDLMSKALPADKFERWLAANGHPPHPPVIDDRQPCG